MAWLRFFCSSSSLLELMHAPIMRLVDSPVGRTCGFELATATQRQGVYMKMVNARTAGRSRQLQAHDVKALN